MEEVFVKDCETGLLVSNLGRVVGLSGRIVNGFYNERGYQFAGYKDATGKRCKVRVHRLVARNFIPNPKSLPFINHKDENPRNNRVDNLEWCDIQYNNTYGTVIERHKKSLRDNGRTKHCILEKDGKIYEAESYVDMERICGLKAHNVCSISRGIVTNCFGFHLPGKRVSNHTSCKKSITLTNGEQTVSFKSLSEAARYLGTSRGNVSGLYNGIYKSLRGWHLIGVDVKRKFKTKAITLSNGLVTKTYQSYTEAARDIGSCHSNISNMVSGRRKICNGWMLVS